MSPQLESLCVIPEDETFWARDDLDNPNISMMCYHKEIDGDFYGIVRVVYDGLRGVERKFGPLQGNPSLGLSAEDSEKSAKIAGKIVIELTCQQEACD